MLTNWHEDQPNSWETLDQGVLEKLANFHSLKNIKGYGAMKLFKATRKQHGEVTALLTVPARAWHVTRPDKTVSLTIFCHTAVLTKVVLAQFPCVLPMSSRAKTSCAAQSISSIRFLESSPSHAYVSNGVLAVFVLQFGNLRLCEPYAQMNKRLPAFGGFSDASEEKLEKQSRSMLRGLIRNKRDFLCQQLIDLGKTTDSRLRCSVRAVRAPP